MTEEELADATVEDGEFEVLPIELAEIELECQLCGLLESECLCDELERY